MQRLQRRLLPLRQRKVTMNKTVSMLLVCVLTLTLCACGTPAAPIPEPTVAPAESVSPTVAPTPVPTEAPTPAPTEESAPTPTPFPFVKSGEETAYSLMPTADMSDGAKALMYWLLGEGMELAESFFADELGEGMFTLPADPVKNDISPATEQTRCITLLSEPFPADCGLLEMLLSRFEAEYGYIVEVCVGKGETAENYLRSGMAELVLASAETGNHLRDKKLVNARYPLICTKYVPGT